MTQEEKQYCDNCHHHKDCPYVLRGLERKCVELDTFSSGFEAATEKAIGWIDNNACKYVVTKSIHDVKVTGIDVSMTVELRKYMEGQV